MEITGTQADVIIKDLVKDLASQLMEVKQERTKLREALRAIRMHINDATIGSEECLNHVSHILDSAMEYQQRAA